MKKIILTTITVLCIGLTTRAQFGVQVDKEKKISFELNPRYSRPIKKDKLNGVKLISDVIPGFPVNWVTSYVSVEIVTNTDGKFTKGSNANETLSTEQKNILSNVDIGTDIEVNINYKYKDPSTNGTESNVMHTKLTVVPDVEAEFTGGQIQLKKYLNENGINKITPVISQEFKRSVVRFTINEEGKVINTKLHKASGDQRSDQLLLEAINKMPEWKPAKNSKGVGVKQDFEFVVGYGVGGC